MGQCWLVRYASPRPERKSCSSNAGESLAMYTFEYCKNRRAWIVFEEDSSDEPLIFSKKADAERRSLELNWEHHQEEVIADGERRFMILWAAMLTVMIISAFVIGLMS